MNLVLFAAAYVAVMLVVLFGMMYAAVYLSRKCDMVFESDELEPVAFFLSLVWPVGVPLVLLLVGGCLATVKIRDLAEKLDNFIQERTR